MRLLLFLLFFGLAAGCATFKPDPNRKPRPPRAHWDHWDRWDPHRYWDHWGRPYRHNWRHWGNPFYDPFRHNRYRRYNRYRLKGTNKPDSDCKAIQVNTNDELHQSHRLWRSHKHRHNRYNWQRYNKWKRENYEKKECKIGDP